MSKKQFNAEIKEIRQVARDLFLIKFSPDGDFSSTPGQFVSILIPELTLRRPFSILNFEKDTISVLFKKKGRGTEYLSSLKIGDKINFIGAMGNGFNINPKQKSLLIGAGVGVAPIFYAKSEQKLESLPQDKFVTNKRFIAGFQTKEDIPNFMEFDFVTTDDNGGSIINYVEKEIQTYKPDIIYSCGPTVVMKLITEIAQKYNINSVVSMENLMACSIGVCRGCVIEIIKDGKIQNATVCKNGPVFDGGSIIWQG